MPLIRATDPINVQNVIECMNDNHESINLFMSKLCANDVRISSKVIYYVYMSIKTR